MENNYGIGSTGRPNELFVDIPQNRTLILEKLTKDAPNMPEVVHGLQTIQQVFEHYKPEVAVEFEDAQGFIKRETLTFKDIDDFELRRITEQSAFLKDNTARKEEYLRIIYQLNSNRELRAASTDPEARKALLDAINAMIAELNNK
jgi:hypothetical protein